MADVIDFIILKQNYDIAMSRNWKVGKFVLNIIGRLFGVLFVAQY